MIEVDAEELIRVLRQTLLTEKEKIVRVEEQIASVLLNKGSFLICGNGGSAAEAQHLSAEIMVRFKKNRRAIPAIALSTDTSILTATGNDYSFDTIFSRQVEALATEKDLLICLSTSGKSKNIINAAEVARKKKCYVLSLTGKDENPLTQVSDLSLNVQSEVTAHIQEVHLFLIHHFADIIEKKCIE